MQEGRRWVRRSPRRYNSDNNDDIRRNCVDNITKYKLIIKQTEAQAKKEQLHKVVNNLQNLKALMIELRSLIRTSAGHRKKKKKKSPSIIIINPLTARVVGAPQMILQPVFSIFPCSPLPSGTCRTPGLSIP